MGFSIENNKELNSDQIKTWKFTTKDSLKRRATYFLKVNLEKTFVSKYDLVINYSEDIKGEINFQSALTPLLRTSLVEQIGNRCPSSLIGQPLIINLIILFTVL